MYFLTQLLNGLGVGAIYALVALGYSMVYGIVQLINFAHGDIIMVGSFTVYTILSWNFPVPVAVMGSILFCAIVGMIISRVAYQRLLNKGAPRIALLITAIGVSMLLQNLALLIFIVLFTAAIHRQVLREEKFLQAHYGQEYEDYARKVRRYL